MSPRKAAARADRDRSAQHGWNGSKELPGNRGQAAIAPQPLTDRQKADGALQLAGRATSATELRELLAAAGLDQAELRAIRARQAPAGTP